jgi:hypothetical protein
MHGDRVGIQNFAGSFTVIHSSPTFGCATCGRDGTT